MSTLYITHFCVSLSRNILLFKGKNEYLHLFAYSERRVILYRVLIYQLIKKEIYKRVLRLGIYKLSNSKRTA